VPFNFCGEIRERLLTFSRLFSIFGNGFPPPDDPDIANVYGCAEADETITLFFSSDTFLGAAYLAKKITSVSQIVFLR